MNLSEKAARRFPNAGDGAAPVAAPVARHSGGGCGRKSSAVAFVRKKMRRQGSRGRRRLPRSPIYRGGVVTGVVTTPPGSLVVLELCGIRVAAQACVYAKRMEGYMIVYAARARDLRRQRDPASVGLYPADPGKAPVHDLTTRRPGFPGFGEILCQVSPGFREGGCKFDDSVKGDSGKSDAASRPSS